MVAMSEQTATRFGSSALCCTRCGYLDTTRDGLCPTCSEQALDLSVVADYEIAEYLVNARRAHHDDASAGYAVLLTAMWIAFSLVVLHWVFPLVVGQLWILVFYPPIRAWRRGRKPAALFQLEEDLQPRRAPLVRRGLTGAPTILLLCLVAGALVIHRLGSVAAPYAEVVAGDLDLKIEAWFGYFLARPHLWSLVPDALFLFSLGIVVDLRTSRMRALVAFFVGAIAGGMAHALWGTGVLTGPSAGLVALAGVQATLLPHRRQLLLFRMIPVVGQTLWMAPLLASVYLVIEGVGNGVSWPACAAGALVGGALGLLYRRVPESNAFRELERRHAETLARLDS